jgi:6-pyruvoyltetrahydropterin/6-carboxytetrahydropterin synthase
MNHSVTKLIHFCYGHRLLEYAGKCRHLHGHNGLVEVTCESAKLDKLGMVLDFDEIKQKVQVWIDSELDHKLILNEADPLIPDLKKGGQPMVLFKGNPTAEAIAKHIYEYCAAKKLPVTSVRVWETPSASALYRG